MDMLLFNIDNIRKKIREIIPLLICDKWDENKNEVIEIINDLKQVLQMISSMELKEEIIELQKCWLVVIDALLKAIKFEDSIQIADLLQYDLELVLDTTLKIDYK